MRRGVDLLQLAERDLRVDLRRRKVRVPQDHLDVTDVRAVLQHVRGARVAEQMAGAGMRDASVLEMTFDEIAQPSRRERPAVIMQEQRMPIVSAFKLGAHFAQVLVDPRTGALPDRHHAILVALAVADHECALREVDLVELQVNELHAPDAARVQRLEDRAIAHTERRRDLALVQHVLDIRDREDPARQGFGLSRQLEVRGGVIQKMAIGLRRQEDIHWLHIRSSHRTRPMQSHPYTFGPSLTPPRG